MIRLSLHPSPSSETSAFNRMRAFRKPLRRALALADQRFKLNASALSRATYRFTEGTLAAMISSIARIAMDKESLNPFRDD